MTNPITDSCFCKIPVNTAACLIAVLDLVFIFVFSAVYFSALNHESAAYDLPYDLRNVIYTGFDQSNGEYYLVLALLAAQFVSALLMLFGHVVQSGKFYWPLIVLNIGIISQDAFDLIAEVINRRTLNLQQIAYFAFIFLAFYLTAIIYRGKRHVDFVCQQRREFAAIRELAKQRDFSVSNPQPSAPVENEYSVVRY